MDLKGRHRYVAKHIARCGILHRPCMHRIRFPSAVKARRTLDTIIGGAIAGEARFSAALSAMLDAAEHYEET
jgi:hypothetical protein